MKCLKAHQRLCTLVLIVTMITTPVLRADGYCPPPNASPFARLTPEQIYAGLFFGNGLASTLLPEVFGPQSPFVRSANQPTAMLPLFQDAVVRLRSAGDAEGAELVESVVATVTQGLPNQSCPSTSARALRTHALVTRFEADAVISDLFTAQIKRQTPQFFTVFGAGVRSGNPLLTEIALQSAAQETYRAGRALLVNFDTLEPAARNACVYAAVVLVAAAAVALALALWSVVVLIEGVVVFTTATLGTPGNALLHDQAVARITRAFAPTNATP